MENQRKVGSLKCSSSFYTKGSLRRGNGRYRMQNLVCISLVSLLLFFLVDRYKADGILPAKPEAVFKCMEPEAGGLREKWDKNVKELLIIEKIDENLCITRTITPSAFMKIISPRDFLDVVLIQQDEDGTIGSVATNVEHPQCPPEPGYVRGTNYPCGCFCIPVPGEPGKTQLLSFFQSDLSGNLPHSIVDSFFASSIAEFYSNLTKAVKTLVA